MLMKLVLVLVALWQLAAADLKIENMQSSYSSGSSVTVSWEDDGSSPPLSAFSTVTILLCTGPNANIHCFTNQPLTSTVSAASGKYSFQVSSVADLGASGPYYLQLVAIEAGQGKSQTIHYSDRFDLTGMTGSYKPSDGGDTSPPNAQNENNSPQDVASLASVSYTLQTGATRLAPMQLQPGTKVTVQGKPSPLFPTSAVTYFSAISGTPKQMTTLTPSWSYTITSVTNMVPTQSQPSGYKAARPTGQYSSNGGLQTGLASKSK